MRIFKGLGASMNPDSNRTKTLLQISELNMKAYDQLKDICHTTVEGLTIAEASQLHDHIMSIVRAMDRLGRLCSRLEGRLCSRLEGRLCSRLDLG